MTWKLIDHHEVQRPQGLDALWGITENDPVIPCEGAILPLIWHLFGTDFYRLTASQRTVLRVPRWLHRLLLLVDGQRAGRTR